MKNKINGVQKMLFSKQATTFQSNLFLLSTCKLNFQMLSFSQIKSDIFLFISIFSSFALFLSSGFSPPPPPPLSSLFLSFFFLVFAASLKHFLFLFHLFIFFFVKNQFSHGIWNPQNKAKSYFFIINFEKIKPDSNARM